MDVTQHGHGVLYRLQWNGNKEVIPLADREPNRLIHEASPCLQQHAYKPVDWYPWGEEALGKVKREYKPMFLSTGYSACHWWNASISSMRGAASLFIDPDRGAVPAAVKDLR
jgi:hypothetical protein